MMLVCEHSDVVSTDIHTILAHDMLHFELDVFEYVLAIPQITLQSCDQAALEAFKPTELSVKSLRAHLPVVTSVSGVGGLAKYKK